MDSASAAMSAQDVVKVGRNNGSYPGAPETVGFFAQRVRGIMTDQEASSQTPYEMSITLGVLDHLGLNLYSNVPAVVSEIVANAWDADASRVEIQIDTKHQRVTVTDDGEGMNLEGVNERFLKIGYRRREDRSPTTGKGRHVMGRKGIGKLSMFSIAKTVEVHTLDRSSGAPEGFILDADDIRLALEDGETDYRPAPIKQNDLRGDVGTTLVLKRLRRRVNRRTIDGLRKRLARRFAVIDEDFVVTINGEPIGPEDRDYFKSLEFLWSIGDVGDSYVSQAPNVKRTATIPGIVGDDEDWEIHGWVGTFDAQRSISDDLNSIVVMAWGKLVQEDVLPQLRASGLFANYVIGEIHADFLDEDDEMDIATSDRQRMREDDPRYVALVEYMTTTVIRAVGNAWRDWRREQGIEEARQNPALEAWLDSLTEDSRSYAEKLLGEIGKLPLDEEQDRSELYRHAVLAFERLRLRDSLSRIEDLKDGFGPDLLKALVAELDELEAIEYHSIVRGRLEVIRLFASLVDDDAKERALQDHIFEHLWLLDPSWERAATDARVEQTVGKEFGKIRLTKEEKRGRIDIRYKTSAGSHVIIELKRFSSRVTATELLDQLTKYRNALEKVLRDSFEEPDPHISLIAILGSPPGGGQTELEKRNMLRNIGARWITYDTLINDAQRSYHEYLEADERVARIREIIDSI